MAKTRVIVADRNTLTCEGMCALLKAFKNIEVVGSATNSDEMIELVRAKSPDIVLMDMAMPLTDVGAIIQQIRQENGEVKVLLVSEYEDRERILKGLQAGGNGYLPKRARPSDLASAITAIYRGGYFLYPSVAKTVVGEYLRLRKNPGSDPFDLLSDRETEVLKLVAAGYKSREIAEALRITFRTVLGHRTRVMAKLGLHSQTELVKYAIRKHLVDLEQ